METDRPMPGNKYAIIMCSSDRGYWIGGNSNLNAFDYYGLKDIDVHLCSHSVLGAWLDYAKDRFNYPLYVHSVPEICGRENNEWKDHDFLWARWGLAKRIADDYEAVMFIDSRCFLVNDVSEYFSKVAGTKNILCPESPYVSGKTLSDMNKDGISNLDNLCRDLPIRPNILFLDLRNHKDLIDAMWSAKDNYMDEKHLWELPTPVDCYLEAWFCKNMFLLNKLDDIIYLPHELWLSNFEILKNPITEKLDYPRGLFRANGDRINCIHGPYWGRGWTWWWGKDMDHSSEEYTNVRNYVKFATGLSIFFNYHWKLRLDAPEMVGCNPFNTLSKDFDESTSNSI